MATTRAGRAEQAARLRQVRSEAQRVLATLGVAAAADLDIDAIARAHRAEIGYEWIDGAQARVVRVGDRARICISTAIPDANARRFSAAHEIGHLALAHKLDGDANGKARTCAPPGRGGARPFREREADVYAAELLMPAQLVAQLVQDAPVTLDTARMIARTFRTSLHASASKLVELSCERCALAYCTLGEVEYLVRSATFPASWVPKRRPVDARAVASDYFSRGTLDPRPRVMSADAWLPANHAHDIPEIVEQAATVPACGAVISLLWIPRAGEPVRAVRT